MEVSLTCDFIKGKVKGERDNSNKIIKKPPISNYPPRCALKMATVMWVAAPRCPIWAGRQSHREEAVVGGAVTRRTVSPGVSSSRHELMGKKVSSTAMSC